MKIRTTLKIQKDGRTIKGQITETIYEDGEKRGDCKNHYSKDGVFRIRSSLFPSLVLDYLAVWGFDEAISDDIVISYTYKTKEQAQKVMSYINEFTVESKETDQVDKSSDQVEPTTFNCSLKALVWLEENPMREIELVDGYNHINNTYHIFIYRYNNKTNCIEWRYKKSKEFQEDGELTYYIEN